MRNGNGNGFGRLYERWPQYDAAQENGASANNRLRISHTLLRNIAIFFFSFIVKQIKIGKFFVSSNLTYAMYY